MSRLLDSVLGRVHTPDPDGPVESDARDATPAHRAELATAMATVCSGVANAAVEAEVAAAEAHTVADAAERMAEGVADATQSVEEFASSIGEISRNTSQAAEVVHAAAMASEQSMALVSELSASSQEIGKMVDLINRIAHQTDLLALNATIEAARAGDVGKGFAVVASEVKELARATEEATTQITAMVQRLQHGAEAAGIAISEIGALVEQFNERHSSIAAAVEEQAASTAEVTRVLTSLTDDSQHLAATMTSVADSAYRATFATSKAKAAANAINQHPSAEEIFGGQSTSAGATDPLAAAIGAHSDWKARLAAAIDNGGEGLDPATIGLDDKCAFGTWLHGAIEPRYRSSASYEDVRALHAAFHRQAADVVRLAQQGRVAEARAAIAAGQQFASTSAELTGQIDQWRRGTTR